MIEIPKWMREVDIDKLPEVYKPLTELIGYENMLKMVALYGGTPYYVPKLDALQKALRDDQLMADYAAGRSPDQLARKYNLSVVQVYEIIKNMNRKSGVTGDQLSLLDATS